MKVPMNAGATSVFSLLVFALFSACPDKEPTDWEDGTICEDECCDDIVCIYRYGPHSYCDGVECHCTEGFEFVDVAPVGTQLTCMCEGGRTGEKCERCDEENGWHLAGSGEYCTKDPCDPNPCTQKHRTICESDEYVSAQCLCTPGYELEPDGTCLRREYRCSAVECGADLEIRKCSGDTCQVWHLHEDCELDKICSPLAPAPSCLPCKHGCENGHCLGSEQGPCNDNGVLSLPGKICQSEPEYRCSAAQCGAEAQQRQVHQTCPGNQATCTGSQVVEDWLTIETCEQICTSDQGSEPACISCPDGLSCTYSGQCGPASGQRLVSPDSSIKSWADSVAIDGQFACVGFCRGPEDGIHVFRKENDTWQFFQQLDRPAVSREISMGHKIAMSDSHIITQVHEVNSDGINIALAFVYGYDGKQWDEGQVLTAPGDDWTSSVSVSGNSVLIGSSYAEVKDMYAAGHAQIFQFDGKTWRHSQKIHAADANEDDYFGESVSIDEDFAIIGAPEDDEKDIDAGAAYIFMNDSGHWHQVSKLIALDGQAGDNFGESVSLSGSYAIVGAPHDYISGQFNGSAYVFHNDEGEWKFIQKLTPSDGLSIWQRFGSTVSMKGEYALIGAGVGSDKRGHSVSETAYVFHRAESKWIEIKRLVSLVNPKNSDYADSLSISSDHAIVGDSEESANEVNFGVVYIF